jgi:hypothetical protein
MDHVEALTCQFENVDALLTAHKALCGLCRPYRLHEDCATAVTLQEAILALCWAIPLVQPGSVEHGTHVRYTGTLTSAHGDGWTVNGWCRCDEATVWADRQACTDQDLYQLTHKDGRVLLHVSAGHITAI